MPIKRTTSLDPAALSDLLNRQSGVVSRAQLLSADVGASPSEVRALLDSRRLAVVLPGVYVDHTGPPTWLQRAWAGVVHAAPAALDRDSSLRAGNGPGWRGRTDDEPIQLVIDTSRRIRVPEGFIVRRLAGLDGKVLWNASPPRLRSEHATLDAAVRAATQADRVEALARSVRSRQTTATRLLAALEDRPRVRERAFLEGVLTDIRDGTQSVLEHAYLARVERPHRLPRGARQVRESGLRVVARDVTYGVGLVVELDGRLDHLGGRERARDLARDVELTVSGRQGVRLGWSQVFDQPCRTAGSVAAILRARGWAGWPVRCGDRCSLDARKLGAF